MLSSAGTSPYEATWSGAGPIQLGQQSSDQTEGFDARASISAIVFCVVMAGVVALATFIYSGTIVADNSRGESGDVEVIGSKETGDGGSVTVGSKPRTSRPPVTRVSRATTPVRFTTTPLPNGAELAARLIKEALNRSYAPCDDFYNFVCGTFSGEQDVIAKLGTHTEDSIKDMLATMHIPARFQTATEKAAGLYRACYNLASDPRGTQVYAVQAFLSKLNLDISNIDYDPNFDILNRLVYLSFVYGFPAFVKFSASFGFAQDTTIDIAINTEDETWMVNAHIVYDGANLKSFYMLYLRMYDRNLDSEALSGRIIRAERVVIEFLRKIREHPYEPQFKTVGDLGSTTEGYVSHGEWVRLIEQATSKSFTSKSPIVLQDDAPALVVLLLDQNRMTRNDSRLLIAWSLVHQLLSLASSVLMDSEDQTFPDRRRRLEHMCYNKVIDVMPLAASLRYFSTYLPPSALNYVRRMAADVKRSLIKKLNETEWIQGTLWCMMYEKVLELWFMLAYPKVADTESMLEDFFLDVPDNGGNFTAPYLAARRVVTLNTFRRNFDVSFDTATVNAFFSPQMKSVHIMGGLLQPPVFISGAPAAYNYGGIGQVLGHELMHAFDVRGITLTKNLSIVNFENTTTKQLYTSKVLCLRSSYEQAESESRGRTLEWVTDSEGFVDFAGVQLAHAAYRSLPDAERRATLPYGGLTTEQTFFVAYCLKWCTSAPGTRRVPGGLYWHGRSRCIVPLRNMPQFAEAFSCKPGDRMNPVKKCSFW